MAGPQDSVLVEGPAGQQLVGIHADRERIPASILKILTSLAAIETLGAEFRFKTEFYIDSENNLKIKGYGDPILVSERLAVICANLATRLDTVRNIILDDTYFSQPIRIPGRGTSLEPYDAPNGALCVNFNTVAFTRRNGRWISDEPQTPLLPSVIPLIEASGLSSGRITLAAGRDEALDYTGAMFRYFLNQNGTTVRGSIIPGRIATAHDRMIWQYHSDVDLAQAVSKLLEYSNNFIANQLLLIIGAETKGPPASMDKGLAVLKNFYRDTLQLSRGRIVEASGISRQNRISARGMMTILNRFSPYHKLMRKQNRQYYKTGHLKGVRSRAGYIASQDGKLYRFVVIVNTPGKSTHRIMKVLEKELR
jgi:D-alanyl-D-alanine carboxypeptidase/D-alanyl-D-alanine-endopeptidase (penicillin-binding protein 4)